jgi:chromosome partitioning protein
MTAQILSVVNLKGGVGKTAIAVNFAAYCGHRGKKTLLIDLDPQTNATFSCVELDAWQEHASKKGSVADLLGAKTHASAEGAIRTAEDVLWPNVFKNVDLVPSHLDLFTVDLDLAGATARETKLRRAITPLLDKYEIIVCDCPPNLTIPTQNAIALSSFYVVPISPDYLSGLGVGLLITRVTKLCHDLEHNLTHLGIVMSRVGRPARHREETIAALRNRFGELVLNQEIKERAAVSESAAKNLPIYDMGDTAAADEFRAVSEELLKRMGQRP